MTVVGMESSAAPAAGWFPDPGDPSAERWWSGVAWTEHTRQPLDAEVPAAFAPHVATLLEERPEPQPEAEPFVFSMTPSTAEPVAAGFTMPSAEPQAPAFTMPSAEPQPAIAPASDFPVPPPAPAPAPAPAYAAPAPVMPEFTVPSPSPALGAQTEAPAAGYAFPSAPAAPTLPADEVAPSGFVLPAAPAAPLTTDAPQPHAGRHADAAPEPPMPAAPALPAVRPVGFTSSADPEVASRYRSVIHADSQEELQAQAVAAAAPAPMSMLASTALATGRPMGPTTPYYSAPATNKAADLALRTGLGAAVGVVVSFAIRVIGLADLAGGVLTLGAWVSGVVALVSGIVGLVLARRRGVGFGKSLAGLLLGLFVAVVVPIVSVLLVVALLGALGFL
ncbi:MAG: DUF2510 domain-containing protein [Microbacteriaceae bacterium]|nr:MAG: DUF2510 domain-containing protein [Microbacteriaceae bacterium]